MLLGKKNAGALDLIMKDVADGCASGHASPRRSISEILGCPLISPEIVLETHVVLEWRTRLEFDEQIEIRAWPVVATRHGAEYPCLADGLQCAT